MPKRRLTDEQFERMVEMRERGRSYRQIAMALGCSEKAVSWHCLRLGAETPTPAASWEGIRGPAVMMRNGHQVRRYTDDDDAKLLEFEAQGLSVTEIGRRLGRRWNSVRGRLMTLARRDERREAAA